MRMSAKEFREFLAKTGQSAAGYDLPALSRPAKYRNKRVYVHADGFVSYEEAADIKVHGSVTLKFDSVKEYERWNDLLLMERAGAISNLKRQEVFEIQPAFLDGTKKQQAIKYKADFTYIMGDKEIVEDVKGFDVRTQKHITTKDFRLKWKLLQHKYPSKKFQIY